MKSTDKNKIKTLPYLATVEYTDESNIAKNLPLNQVMIISSALLVYKENLKQLPEDTSTVQGEIDKIQDLLGKTKQYKIGTEIQLGLR
jgi:hypothetical protein